MALLGGYKNILPSKLTILPSSSTRAILLTSLAIYSCIPLKAIQYYIIIYDPTLAYSDLFLVIAVGVHQVVQVVMADIKDGAG